MKKIAAIIMASLLVLSVFAEPRTPPCKVWGVHAELPLWNAHIVDSIQQGFNIPAPDFTGIPTDCGYPDILPLVNYSGGTQISFSNLYPYPRQNNVRRFIFESSPMGNEYELQLSEKLGHWKTVVRVRTSACPNHFVVIDVPSFPDCLTLNWRVVRFNVLPPTRPPQPPLP